MREIHRYDRREKFISAIKSFYRAQDRSTVPVDFFFRDWEGTLEIKIQIRPKRDGRQLRQRRGTILQKIVR